MIDDDEIPDHCSHCDNEPTVGINGAVFCDDHAEQGFAAAGRAMAVASGVTDERRLVAAERAMVDMYLEAKDMEVIGDTATRNTGVFGDDVN